MRRFSFLINLGILLGIGCWILGIPMVFASTTDGTVSGYAWSDQIGWINFGTTNGNVHITDSLVTGYAWNENTGRINLAPTTSGVANNSEGTLSGYAFAEGTGWINFSGVTVNSSGVFSGTATGDNNVTIYFSCNNCNVSTDWRPASSRSSGSTGTTGGGGGGTAYGPPQGPFSIAINNSNKYTNSATVTLSLTAGYDAVEMMISNSDDFSKAVKETFQSKKTWILPAGDGVKTVYAKFYTKHGVASKNAVYSSIILDTQTPTVKVDPLKESYLTNEDIIVSGLAEANSSIVIFVNGKYGTVFADESGKWSANIGKLTVGSYNLKVFARDLAENIGQTVILNVSVLESQEIGQQTEEESPLSFAFGKIKDIFDKWILGKPESEQEPVQIVTVPESAQFSMGGIWRLLPEKPIERFALAPLPQDLKLLAQQFPEVGETFSEVGVTKVTDVQKVKNSNLSLPGLTEAVGLGDTELKTGKLTLIKGIPVAQLSSFAKSKIPSDIVFTKTGGGLVDFNIALSINNQGKAEQTITTLVGSPLQLVVRPEAPAKKVYGYVVFKSKNKNNQTALNIPLDSLSASYIFSNPDFLSVAAVSQAVSLEGAEFFASNVVTEPEIVSEKEIETRLVLQDFNYENAGNGVYTATIQTPVVDGEYEVVTVIDYIDENIKSKEIKLITVVDPEGYIYEKNGNKETRVSGAVASLYWLNPETKQYELWPAKDYQQENPQITDVRGTYSFLVPDGFYYIKVEAPGYLSYDGKPFEVKEGSGVHINIELKTRYWFLNIVDWKTVLLIMVVLMLLYNFYKDRMREKRSMALSNNKSK